MYHISLSPIYAPPRICTCICDTVCPADSPLLLINLKPSFSCSVKRKKKAEAARKRMYKN